MIRRLTVCTTETRVTNANDTDAILMSATQNEVSTVPSDDSQTETPAESQTVQEETTEGAVDEPPLDQTFELLKNKRRRAVLNYLQETEDEVVSIGELAEHIAAIENDIDVDSVSSSQRKRAYVGLYQCHLPKMDDMGVIEFQKNRGKISRAKNARQLEQFLNHTPGAARPWYRYYLVVALAGMGLFALSQLGVLAAGASLTVLIAGILSCGVIHAYEEGGLTLDLIPGE